MEAKQVDASALVRKLIEGAPSEEFDFVHWDPEGRKQTSRIRVQLLRVEENLQAIHDAQQTAKELGEVGTYGDIYKESQAVELIQRALRQTTKVTSPDGTAYYPCVFTDSRQVRASLTEPAMAVILNCYEIVKAKFGAIESLEEKDAEAWIARLSDPLRGPFFLSQLDSRHWPGLIFLLAGMARSLYESLSLPLPSLDGTSDSQDESSTADTGSSGEQPSASSTADPDLAVPVGKVLTRDEARELVAKRKGEDK